MGPHHSYEAHVKGFTKKHPEVPESIRGTYKGLAQKVVGDYIKSLGVTSIELLPIHSFIQDNQLLEKGLANYWGYNTMAPSRRCPSQIDPRRQSGSHEWFGTAGTTPAAFAAVPSNLAACRLYAAILAGQ